MSNILKEFYRGNLSKARGLLEQTILSELQLILKRLTEEQITFNNLTFVCPEAKMAKFLRSPPSLCDVGDMVD